MNKVHTFQKLLMICSLACTLMGCNTSDNTPVSGGSDKKTSKIIKAKVILSPTKGNKAHGTVFFTSVQEGVKVVADLDGLTPGKHGFHVHEKGDCSAPDASSAGAHYNPSNSHHGSPDSKDRHAGDLGNIEADSVGHAHYERIDAVIKLEGPNSIIGRSVIVHAEPDDFISQPSGNAGAKVSCGVIERFH